ncbi:MULTISPECIES: transcriptional activator NhaR [Ramlibacter]|uniref:Transcriptional activator NhaR n=1 Tax=Ramlibacter aquaticus TaxID=2780094 RepID=A0ABR9SHJ9_9BURK|nr:MULTISPECIES: transcriptional activator NhaR [Ramlibacter]MBE7941512.1 transcriptional activator NhaR [Ramlibacter aquaticus]
MNYKHLQYFWTVVRAGGVLKAAQQLHLTPQTLSGQIHLLEERLGAPLLRKAGRGVEPTEAGRLVMQYADEIFTLGGEMQDALRGGRDAAPAPLVRIGIVDSVPKSIAFHVVEPAWRALPPPRLQCTEGKLTQLLGELALRRLELVVSDVPLPGNLGVKAYAHLLGRSRVAFFASRRLLPGRRLPAPGAFPAALAALPLLMPGPDSALRPRLEAWLRRQGLAVRVVAEFDDSALMKAFGREGGGAFPAPAVLAPEIQRQYDVVQLGIADGLLEEFYGISVERRITHPAIAAITAAVRTELLTD